MTVAASSDHALGSCILIMTIGRHGTAGVQLLSTFWSVMSTAAWSLFGEPPAVDAAGTAPPVSSASGGGVGPFGAPIARMAAAFIQVLGISIGPHNDSIVPSLTV